MLKLQSASAPRFGDLEISKTLQRTLSTEDYDALLVQKALLQPVFDKLEQFNVHACVSGHALDGIDGQSFTVVQKSAREPQQNDDATVMGPVAKIFFDTDKPLKRPLQTNNLCSFHGNDGKVHFFIGSNLLVLKGVTPLKMLKASINKGFDLAKALHKGDATKLHQILQAQEEYMQAVIRGQGEYKPSQAG
jgi:hypothetical protein